MLRGVTLVMVSLDLSDHPALLTGVALVERPVPDGCLDGMAGFTNAISHFWILAPPVRLTRRFVSTGFLFTLPFPALSLQVGRIPFRIGLEDCPRRFVTFTHGSFLPALRTGAYSWSDSATSFNLE